MIITDRNRYRLDNSIRKNVKLLISIIAQTIIKIYRVGSWVQMKVILHCEGTKIPLGSTSDRCFSRGVKLYKNAVFRPKNKQKKGLLYGDTRGRSRKNGDDLDYLETLD